MKCRRHNLWRTIMRNFNETNGCSSLLGRVGKKFLTTTAMTAAGFLSLPSLAHAIDAGALPEGEIVTRGSATYDRSEPNVLNIEQHQALTAAEYVGGFNIGRDAAVIVDQRTGDIFVHKDTSGDTSVLEGLFQGSASNYVLNRNGVLITGTARIDMNGFAASTAESVDFNGTSVTFSDLGNASVEIQAGATINVGDAGLAAFVAPTVKNAGVINAKMGTVAFGAGETVTLDMYGDGLFEVAVEGELADAFLENTGTINAEGGRVQVAALAAKDAVDNIINMDGVVNVASVTQKGGKIILSGGNSGVVEVAGELDASGTDGGDIDITGQNILVGDAAEIKADGNNGDGGDVRLFADNAAIFRGKISAKGGANGGNGGNAEVSGMNYIGYAGLTDLTAANGITGTLLIDPTDIDIVAGATSATIDNTAGVFADDGSNAATASIGWADIILQLALSNVEITTTSGGVAPNGGRITVVDSGAYDSANSLSLNADERIVLNNGVSIANAGTGDLIFDAGGSVRLNANSSVSTGGDFTSTSGGAFRMFNNTSVNAENVTVVAQGYGTNASASVTATDTVNIDRATVGDISLADATGGMNISQNELDSINAATLILGENNTTNLSAENADVSHVASVELNATNDVQFDGDNEFDGFDANAGNDVNILGGSVEAAGDALLDAAGALDIAGSLISLGGGLTLVSDSFSLTDIIEASTGTISFHRKTNGTIGLGSGSGGLQISQAELSAITADTVAFGNANAGLSNTTDIDADTVDLSHVSNTFLNALAASSVDLAGPSSYANLTVNTDTVNVDGSGGAISATGDITMNVTNANLDGDLDASGTLSGTATNVQIVSDANGAEIQDGIDISAAGANVGVAAGTYVGGINIGTNGVTLNGNNAGISAKDGTRVAETVIIPVGLTSGVTITGNGVTVDGFSVQGGARGVDVAAANNVSVLNNILSSASIEGVNAAASNDLLIQGNRIVNAGTQGVAIVGGTNADVLANQITGAGIDGVRATSATDVNIDGNMISANQDGVNLESNAGAIVNNNMITGVDDGVRLANGTGANEITGNSITGASDTGVEVINTDNALVDTNVVDNFLEGIQITNSDGVNVRDNTLTNITNTNIHILDSDNVTVGEILTGNIINSGVTGVHVDNSDTATVSDNTIGGVSADGVLVNNGSDTSIVSTNVINGAGGYGVFVEANGLSVDMNTIDNTGNDAVEVNDSANVQIANNFIGTNGAAGNIVGEGVDVNNSSGANVDTNVINNTTGHGVSVDTSDGSFVSSNTIDDVGGDAVNVFASLAVETTNNLIGTVTGGIAGDGVEHRNSANGLIQGNTIADATANGVFVVGSNMTTVNANTIDNTGQRCLCG